MLRLAAGRWWGWSEQPFRLPGWGASPAFLLDVQPLGQGRNEIFLRFVEVLRPHRPVLREVVLRIQLHRPELVVGTYRDEDGAIRVASIAACSPDWLLSQCRMLLDARPPRFERLEPGGAWTADLYLADLFGTDEQAIRQGNHAAAWASHEPVEPRWTSKVDIAQTLSPWASRLVSLGFRPISQDDRWSIVLTESALLARRSWTGTLIYRAEASWCDDTLRLGALEINRDREHYRADESDLAERDKFESLLEFFLLGGGSIRLLRWAN